MDGLSGCLHPVLLPPSRALSPSLSRHFRTLSLPLFASHGAHLKPQPKPPFHTGSTCIQSSPRGLYGLRLRSVVFT